MEPKPKVVEKSMYVIPVRNKSGRIEINTLLAKQTQECVVINELGHKEDFVKYQKPKLQDAPVDAKVFQDLDKLLERILMLLHKMRHKLVTHPWSKCPLTQVITNLLQSILHTLT